MVLGILRLAEGKAFELLMQAGLNPVELKRTIDERLMQSAPSQTTKMSRASERVLRLMIIEAKLYHADECGSVHLLLALLRERVNFPAMFIEQQFGIDYECIERLFPKPQALPQNGSQLDAEFAGDHPFPGEPTKENKKSKNGTPALDKYGKDMTEQARNGELDPVVGRQIEIERVIQILPRRKKNNPILIGEPGVGKSAIVEGLALRIENGEAETLKGRRIVALDIASMVAGTTYRGQFEERIKTVINELHKHPEIILFVDEIHTIMGAGNAQGSLDAANILKPALARGEVQCIGATTTAEYRKTIEKDGALERRFQKVQVQPTSPEETYTVLTRISEVYGTFHKVQYTEEALHACVQLTDRYISDRCFPDKAIDAMDEAGSMVRLKNPSKTGYVGVEDVAEVISKMTGIPSGNVAEGEGLKLVRMRSKLQGRIIGQDDAIDKVVRAIQRNRAGIKDPGKPIGTFLFFGPTGVGKTQLAKSLAEYLFDSEDNMIRLDMSEYMEKFNVSRLIGAPPGYVGFEEGGQLSERVRRKPYCVVLLDEIEKAHPDVFNLLLQVMDEGRLTDSNGRTVSFRNTILIMTSNVGSRELDEYGSGLGFNTSGKNVSVNRKAVLDKAIRKAFPPEFINRVDDLIFFNPLTREGIEKIIDIEIKGLKKRVLEAGFELRITPAAKRFVADEGYDPNYGARPLKRAIQRFIEDPVSEHIIKERMIAGRKSIPHDKIRVSLAKDKENTLVEWC